MGGYLANGCLELKIAVVKNEQNEPLPYNEAFRLGIFHQKVGILWDIENNMISFSGSDNETASAWISNIEEFKVFRGWIDSEGDYLKTDVARFQRIWMGLGQRTQVFSLPQAVQKRLIEFAPIDITGLRINEAYRKTKNYKPSIRLWSHQLEAVQRWKENGKKCIFEMATGTGKTLAAAACVRIAIQEQKPLITVIAVPFNHLIPQWEKELKRQNIEASWVVASGSTSGWRDKLFDRAREVALGVINSLVILTTHDTFYKEDFLYAVTLGHCQIMLVVDEVHGVGSEVRRAGLLDAYDFRLGLSATPSRWFDPEGTKLLLSYFGVENENKAYVFTLDDAIKKINPETRETFLCPYEYKPSFVSLTDEELEEYIEKTNKIAAAYFASQDKKESQGYFELLCFERQKIIQNATKKYEVLKNLISEMKPIQHCLVYCAPEQLDNVQDILNEQGIINHRFTQKEGTSPLREYGGRSERDMLLESFSEGIYGALVAIRCLDEGVDIPQAQKAIIMASTGNPRQYIQRRGRLLRRYPGKSYTTISDIIVFPFLDRVISRGDPLYEFEKKIAWQEMKRYEEFARVSMNVLECLDIMSHIENIMNRG